MPADRLVARLATILRGGADVHRVLAAKALGILGRRDGVPALLDALLDEDPDVRVDAATALRSIGERSTGAKLMESLIGDPSTGVKLAALDALIAMRHQPVVPWLRRILKRRDEAIAWDDSAIYQDGWDDWIDMQVKAVAGLGAFGAAGAAADVVAVIDDEFGQDLSEQGFRTLARMGDEGIAALSRYLDSGDARLQRRAAAALATCEAPAAREVMGRALKACSSELRAVSLHLMAARDPCDPRLSGLLADPQAEIRADAVHLIGRFHAARTAALLADPGPQVQIAALEAIAGAPAQFGGEELAGLVHTKVQTGSAEMRAAAVRTLGALSGDKALDEVLGVLTDRQMPPACRRAAVTALGHIGGDHAIAGFIAVLGDNSRQLRLDAMAQLLRNARENDWPNSAGFALLSALRGELVRPPEEDMPPAAPEASGQTAAAGDDDCGRSAGDFPTSTLVAITSPQPRLAPVGEAAETTIGNDDEEFLELSRQRAMRKQKVSPNPQVAPYQDVRRFAAKALGGIAHSEVAAALADVLSVNDEELQTAAAQSLAQIGSRLGRLAEDVGDKVVAALGAAKDSTRLAMMRVLCAAPDPRHAGVIRECLKDADVFVRIEAIRGLGAFGDTTGEIEEALSDSEPGVRTAAAQALAARGGAEALEKLVRFAFHHNGFHKEMAARLLRGIDAPAATNRFLDVLENEERMQVWAVAIAALVELNRPQADLVPTV